MFADAQKYTQTFALLSNLFDSDAKWRVADLLKLNFPQEFIELLKAECARYNLDPWLALSLMRQESAFNPQALSRSNAVGLMQMIPPTAEEVKAELGSKAEVPQGLYDPQTNVKFCTYYLAKLLKKYEGNVAMSLAAYNAGPTRISAFFKARGKPDVQDLRWVDQLPWSEPSFYVKSILKNLLVNRILYSNLKSIPTPVWSSPEATPNK